ncbi:MAG: MotA/TolQ/ExbB proton channel family protein [Planctomycetota bacterium]
MRSALISDEAVVTDTSPSPLSATRLYGETGSDGVIDMIDLTTIAGLILALVMVLVPYLGGFEAENLALSLFFVLGGTLGATVLSVSRSHLRAALASLAVAFRERRFSARELVESIVKLSETARRDGILSLESKIDDIDDEFLKRAVGMAVDGTESHVVEATLEQDTALTRSRHESGKLVLELIARYAPAYGMLGTLTALIQMLQRWGENAEDHANQMLLQMGFALGTTFCGIFLANTIALPLADKLAEKDRQEHLMKQIVITGIVAIQSGDNPRIVRERLNTFLPPEERILSWNVGDRYLSGSSPTTMS